MTEKTSIKLFEQKQVRSVWSEDEETWYFSIVDVIGVLTDSPNPNNYWKVLKHRLTKEGSQLVTDCNQLKLQSTDGKFYKTDVADTEQLFRLIQSVPSPLLFQVFRKEDLELPNEMQGLSTRHFSTMPLPLNHEFRPKSSRLFEI